MVTVIFKREGKDDRPAEGEAGASVMEVALAHDIVEILADCGGALSCATCHVYIDKAWAEKVGQPSEEEQAMLEMAIDADERSRLSCQIKLTDVLEGLEVILPESQL